MNHIQLTPREQQIADLQRQGLEAATIAVRLGLSLNATRDYIRDIRRKRFMAVCAQVILPGDRRP